MLDWRRRAGACPGLAALRGGPTRQLGLFTLVGYHSGEALSRDNVSTCLAQNFFNGRIESLPHSIIQGATSSGSFAMGSLGALVSSWFTFLSLYHQVTRTPKKLRVLVPWWLDFQFCGEGPYPKTFLLCGQPAKSESLLSQGG